MATRFAFVFKQDLESGLAYIWYNAQAERIRALDTSIVSCVQGTHQQATEKKLLFLIKGDYPSAVIWEDKDRNQYRYIKTQK